MPEVVRPYRGVSADDRRTTRRAQLLEACLDLVGEVGVAATTAELVCARAGLSKRYFYESFADREAVLVAALDDFFAAAFAAIAPVLDEPAGSVEERLTNTVAALVATVSADPRAARLYVESPRHPTLEARRIAAYDAFAQLVLEHGFQADPAVDPRARVVGLLIVSGTTEVLSRWLAGGIDLDEEQIVATIAGIGVACAGLLSATD